MMNIYMMNIFIYIHDKYIHIDDNCLGCMLDIRPCLSLDIRFRSCLIIWQFIMSIGIKNIMFTKEQGKNLQSLAMRHRLQPRAQ